MQLFDCLPLCMFGCAIAVEFPSYYYSFICRLAMIKMRATASSASAAHTFHVRPRVRRSALSVLTVDCSCVLAVWSRSASA